MKRRQMEWKSRQICSSLISELVDEAPGIATYKFNAEIMEDVVNIAWEDLEAQYILELMANGGESLRVKVENRLRQDRELLEAEEQIIKKTQEDRSRKNKMEAVKKLWKKKNLKRDMETLVRALDSLELDDWEREMVEVMEIVESKVLEEDIYMAEGASEALAVDEMEYEEIYAPDNEGEPKMLTDECSEYEDMCVETQSVAEVESMIVEPKTPPPTEF